MKKKLVSIIFLIITVLSTTQPVFATIVNSGTQKWVAGQYDSQMYTTDNKTSVGMLIRRLTNYSTGEKITTFCAEHNVDSPTGSVETGTHSMPTDELTQKACKVAYLGWYSKQGEYAVDGGILQPNFVWVKENYVFTQQYIWEVLGQSTATFKDEEVQRRYVAFKADVDLRMASMEKTPSFTNETITVDIGTTITLTDNNKVLEDYSSIDKTVNGIRIVHNYGENTMNITVQENCDLQSYTFTKQELESYGLIKEQSKNQNTTVYITFKEGVQNQLYAMNYNFPVSMSLNLKINSFGKLELSKLDSGGKLINGAIFEVKGPDNYSQEVTVTGGKIILDKLKKGTYTVKEKSAPNGYLLNTDTYTVQVVPNQTATQNIINKEPTGQISIIKKDSETGEKPQGDATFFNAKYEIYADEDIYNKSKTKKFYSKGDLVATRSMNEGGTTEILENLPLGKYKIKENFSSEGYLIDSKEYQINLEYQNQDTKIISKTVTSYEQVKKMQVHIFKSGIRENSGLVDGLEGAEFTIKLNSDVEKAYSQGYSYAEVWNGVNADKNRIAEAQKIAPTYEKITTDKNGNAYTQEKLPYGKYIVKETITPKGFETATDFTFSITQDESEVKEVAQKVKHLVVNNEQFETYIKLIKKDLKTDKIVTFSNATFEIKATEDIYDKGTEKIIYKKGETIKQKLGSTIYDTFTTNADNIVIPQGSYNNSNDDKGTVTTPLSLPVGTYEIIEIKVPDGFLQLGQTIEFKIEGAESSVKEVIIKNEQPTGTLIINKSVILREYVDKSLVNISDLSEIEFKLIAKEDIIDFADGSIIYKKGQDIKTYNLDKNGNLKIENLPMGNYQLQEVKTLDGLVLDTTLYNIEFTQKDVVTKTYEQTVKITNKTTIVEFSKQDITVNGELIGAKLSVIDENGERIDTWISTEQTHKIEGLIAGKKYILREEQAPEGYKIAEDIEFTVSPKQEEQVVVMKDEPILQETPVIQTGNSINNILLLSLTIVSILGTTVGTIILKRKF